MGYAGKRVERERARTLRAQSWTLLAIATELGVSKSSVSVWCRDVDFVPKPRNRGHPSHKTHPLTVKKHAEIERCKQLTVGAASSTSRRSSSGSRIAQRTTRLDGLPNTPTAVRLWCTHARRRTGV